MTRAEAILQVVEEKALERVLECMDTDDESKLVEAVRNQGAASQPTNWRRYVYPTAGGNLGAYSAVRRAA